MKIESSNLNDVSAVIKVHIAKEDYTTELENQLKGYRKKASIPGFRQGKVPFSLINKMYGKSALLEIVNKVLSEKLFEYIRQENIDMLGEPIFTENFPSIDIDTQEEFEFSFDVALAPNLSEIFKISKKDKVDHYTIPVTEEAINARAENYKAQFGSQEQVDCATEAKDLIKVNIKELDGKLIKEDGIQVEEVFISIDKISDKTILKKVQNIEKGAVVNFKAYKAYKNSVEVAGMLKITPEEVENYKETNFEFTVIEILRFVEAEVNTELFDKVFGPGNVSSEEEFLAKIKLELEGVNAMETDYKFMQLAKEKMISKLDKLELADDILKRWIVTSDNKLTPEQVEEQYPAMLKDLKWQLIKNKVAKDYEVKIEHEDELAYARKVAKVQFMQYGMIGVPQEMMDNYAERMLQTEDQYTQIRNGAFDEKIIGAIKEHIKLEEKTISQEDFNKMIEEQQ